MHLWLIMKNRTSRITFSSLGYFERPDPPDAFHVSIYHVYLSVLQSCIALTLTLFYLLIVSGRNQWILVTYRKSSSCSSTQVIKTFRKLMMQSESRESYLAQSPTNNWKEGNAHFLSLVMTTREVVRLALVYIPGCFCLFSWCILVTAYFWNISLS